MREIKFRAWDKNFKEMVEVTAIDWSKGLLKHTKSGDTWYQLSKFILREFTGLKDRTEKDIFEGDIIDFAGLKPIEILWEENRFKTKMHNSEPINLSKEGCESFAEVIGNKFENKELLK